MPGNFINSIIFAGYKTNICFTNFRISTSSIIIHTLDQLGAVYVNMFSCKGFDPKLAEKFTVKWFGAGDCSARFIERI